VRCIDSGENGQPLIAASADIYPEGFLDDWLADPWKLTNLIGGAAYADVTVDLRARLLKRMADASEGLRKSGLPRLQNCLTKGRWNYFHWLDF